MDNPYQPPQTTLYNSPRNRPLTWTEVFFSFQGRIPRRTYWGATFLMTIFPAFVLGLIMGFSKTKISSGLFEGTAFALLVPIYLLIVYCGFAITTKRWHDRDKSGWWWLVGLIPIIGGLWVLIECGCLRGTDGVNSYGADPT